MLSALREGRRCQSESCMYISADGCSNDTLISQHTAYLSLVVLWRWLEQWWPSACMGAVRSGCIASGCLCNLDVHRKAKFSVMMWSDAIKTLVYSFVCLYFGQHIVYIIKYVEDFQEVFCLILYLRTSCKCLLLSVENYLSKKGSFVCIWPCRKNNCWCPKVHLENCGGYKYF